MWRKSSKLQWMQLKKKSLMLPFKNWKTWPLHRWTQCWKSSQDKRSCRKEMTGEECHATMYPLPHQVHVLYSWKCIGMVTYAFLNLSTHSLGFHKIIINNHGGVWIFFAWHTATWTNGKQCNFVFFSLSCFFFILQFRK